MGLLNRFSSGLSKTRGGFLKQVQSLISGFSNVDEDLIDELEELLILSDVGVKTAHSICLELKNRIKENKLKRPDEIIDAVREIIATIMKMEEPMNLTGDPAVILVIGVNGVGKTTSIGKLASYYRSKGQKVLLAAADTFRAAAIEQLEIWSERSGCPIVKHQAGSDPAAVVYDAITAAKARGYNLVICDTAGRLHNKKNLMDELSKIVRVIRKETEGDIETLLVLDATTGQNAINQAKQFKEAADITGIILTKLDGTAKGGVVVAIKEDLDIPVRFIGVGEGIEDLQPFDPEEFVFALFSSEDLK